MNFIITIDTEADNQWSEPAVTSTENVRFIPRFQALCERFGFAPTYLCTYEVVTSPLFHEVLLPYHRAGTAEIGAHLHPWTTPPFDRRWDAPGKSSPYPSELPLDLFTRKLGVLTEALASRLGGPARSYRAGRWGFAAAHIGPVLEHGYLVDCSVTPLVAWRDAGAREHGQDFTTAPAQPYFMAWDDPCRAGTSSLLEVPVTILHTNWLMRRWAGLRRLYRRHRKALVARALNRALGIAPRWFRPFPDMTVGRLKAVYRTARRLKLPVVEMMFHSSELMPGASPHNPTNEAVEDLYRRLEGIFGYLARQNVEGVTLGRFAERYRVAHAKVGACDGRASVAAQPTR